MSSRKSTCIKEIPELEENEGGEDKASAPAFSHRDGARRK
jgi:hypothetical protein